MPTPAVALKLRRFRRRFGITAPRVVVRSHLPWQRGILGAVILLLLLGVGGWLFAQRNEAGALGLEMESLRQQLADQREELGLLRSTAGTGRQAASIERATRQQLLARIQGLEAENAALKEEMLLYERLMPVAGEGASVRVENFRVVKEANARFRYRLLITFQPDRQSSDFRGRLQLAVNFVQSGRERQLLMPETHDNPAEYRLELKHFLRREGVFELPEGAELKGVEARILQGDTLKSKRMAQL